MFQLQKSFGFTLWQQISENVLSKLYPSATDASKTASQNKHVFTTSTNSPDDAGDADDNNDDQSIETTTKRARHVTLTRGLSKYGPWGYLILGMLLCGGALLLCVLWGKFISMTLHTHKFLFLLLSHIFLLSHLHTFAYTL